MGGGITMKVLSIVGAGFSNPELGQPQITIKAAVLYSPVSADFADIIERWGNGCFGDIAEGEQIIGCNSADVIPVELPSNLRDAYRIAGQDADMLKEVSPIYHLDNVTAPIQIY